MQENEFEKQVKQKMDGFRLRPSEPVWLHVNNELRKKRRRRLLFIPLFTVLLFGGYIMWQSIFPENKISVIKKESLIKNKSTDRATTDASNENDKLNSTPQKTEKMVEGVVPSEKNKNELSVKEEIVPGKPVKQEKNLTAIKENRTKNYIIADKNKITKEIAQNHKASVSNNNTNYYFSKKTKKNSFGVNDNANSENFTGINKREKGRDNSTLNTTQDISLINDAGHLNNDPVLIANNLQREISADSISSNRLSALQLPLLKNDRFNTSNSLKVGFVFAAGVSSRTDKPLQVSSSREKSISALPGYNLGSASGNISGGVLILPPSDVKPGVAFKAGVMAMKPVSNRFDVSAGLLYTYSSDHIQVGKSIASSYYSSSLFDIRAQNAVGGVAQTNYTNKYHYIELPVSVYYNLTGKWKMPLVWNAGVSVSRLISTNALLYDAALGGIYYDGNKDINKTQFNISTGFSLRLTGRNRWQWNIGPEIYISTTKLFNNAYDENKHPLYGGLHIQALVPVKKKHR